MIVVLHLFISSTGEKEDMIAKEELLIRVLRSGICEMPGFNRLAHGMST